MRARLLRTKRQGVPVLTVIRSVGLKDTPRTIVEWKEGQNDEKYSDNHDDLLDFDGDQFRGCRAELGRRPV